MRRPRRTAGRNHGKTAVCAHCGSLIRYWNYVEIGGDWEHAVTNRRECLDGLNNATETL